MNVRFAAAMFLIVVVCSSCDRDPNQATPAPNDALRRPNVSFNVKDADKVTASTALDVLQKTCGGIRGLVSEVAEVNVADETMDANDHGWTRAIRVDMVLRKTDELSGQYQGRADLGGATITFRLGGGREPGISTEHPFGQLLCGASSGPFRAVPALSFIHGPGDSAAAAVAAPAAGASDELPFSWKEEYGPEAQGHARKVLGLVTDLCNLHALRAHIASLRLEVQEDSSYLWVYREYGWKPVVTVAVEMRDDQATWDSLGPDPRRVAGHTFRIMAGRGKRPGLVAEKEWMWKRCNMGIGYGGENGFRDVPELTFLKAERKKR